MIKTVGGLRSILLPPTGPATAQLPARSQTVRLPVYAEAVSLPAGTVVESVKLASAELARPEPASEAVQAMLTLAACQRPSGSAGDDRRGRVQRRSGDPEDGLVVGGIVPHEDVEVLAGNLARFWAAAYRLIR